MTGYIKYIIIFSIPINFVWEMLQMPFYYNMNWDFGSTLFCFAASIGDAVMILLIYFAVSLLLRNKYWILEFKLSSIIVCLIVSILLAIVIEETAMVTNFWKYSNLMPMITDWNIGISPVLQMIILPLLVFKLTSIKIIKLLKSP